MCIARVSVPILPGFGVCSVQGRTAQHSCTQPGVLIKVAVVSESDVQAALLVQALPTADTEAYPYFNPIFVYNYCSPSYGLPGVLSPIYSIWLYHHPCTQHAMQAIPTGFGGVCGPDTLLLAGYTIHSVVQIAEFVLEKLQVTQPHPAVRLQHASQGSSLPL